MGNTQGGGAEWFKATNHSTHDSNQQPIRTEMVAADRIGAGIGDDVLITSGGSSRYIMKDNPLPIDAVVIGIIDSTEVMRGEDNE